METLIKLGQQIAERRVFLKLTQVDIAEIAGLSDTTIRNIEKGKPTVAIGHWIEIAEIVGLEFSLSTKKMSDAPREGIQ